MKSKLGKIIALLAVAVAVLAAVGCDRPDEGTTENPQDKIVLRSEAEQAALDAEKKDHVSRDEIQSISENMKYYEVLLKLGAYHQAYDDPSVSSYYVNKYSWVTDDGGSLYILFLNEEEYGEFVNKFESIDDRDVLQLKYDLERVAQKAYIRHGDEITYLFGGAE